MIVTAPNYSIAAARAQPDKSMFLAGSITGVADWQEDVSKALQKHSSEFAYFNPRRDNYDSLDPAVEEEQITWEYYCLKQCDYILFWFGAETLAPITLFEYGKMLEMHSRGLKKLIIGIHPEYKRKNDVVIQTRLVDQYLSRQIVYSIENLTEKAKTTITSSMLNNNRNQLY
jgi:hypothetical protein